MVVIKEVTRSKRTNVGKLKFDKKLIIFFYVKKTISKSFNHSTIMLGSVIGFMLEF